MRPEVVRDLGSAIGVEPVEGDDAGGVSMKVDSAGFEDVRKAVRNISMEGYSTAQLLIQVSATLCPMQLRLFAEKYATPFALQLHDYIILHPTLTAAQKARCALDFGEADKALVDGGDEELQLLNLCLKLRRDLSKR